MESAYFSAFAALVGSMIGGLTSLTASWLTQHVQYTAQQRASDLSRRQDLYKTFIEEAARCYADAFVHDTADVANLVNLYALASRMRVLSSPEIIASADRVIRVIIETYLAPNRTFHDVKDILDNEAMNPLRDFSNACREELQRRGAS
jgi:hypothetical protein